MTYSWLREPEPDPRPEQDNCEVPPQPAVDMTTDYVLKGVEGFPDLFFGPKNKNYADFCAMRTTKLRGLVAFYWVMQDHHERIQSDSSPYEAPDFLEDDDFFIIDDDFKVHGNVSIYGEPVVVGPIEDTVKREVDEDWQLDSEPHLIRGIPRDPEEEDETSPDGTFVIRRLKFDVPRKMCEELGFRPYYHDVVRLTLKTSSGVDWDGYYDVEKVERSEARYGSTGFFTYYQLTLVRSTKFAPERKHVIEKPPYDVPMQRGNSGEDLLPDELEC